MAVRGEAGEKVRPERISGTSTTFTPPLGFSMELSTEAKDFIAEKGYDSQFGARPLHRAIQKYLEDPLAEEIIKAELAEGDTIEVNFDKESSTLKISVIKAAVAPSTPPPAKTGTSRKKKEE